MSSTSIQSKNSEGVIPLITPEQQDGEPCVPNESGEYILMPQLDVGNVVFNGRGASNALEDDARSEKED